MMSWDRHPGIRTGNRLTRGERAADSVRNNMGSWPFVFIAIVFLSVWMLFNRDTGFDPYPFILLNLVLSCVAAMQGAILLIAAKREDQISSDLAVHTFEIDQENLLITKRIEELTTEVHKLTLAMHQMMKEKGN
jgi:uncharacterized membrane protein